MDEPPPEAPHDVRRHVEHEGHHEPRDADAGDELPDPPDVDAVEGECEENASRDDREDYLGCAVHASFLVARIPRWCAKRTLKGK